MGTVLAEHASTREFVLLFPLEKCGRDETTNLWAHSGFCQKHF